MASVPIVPAHIAPELTPTDVGEVAMTIVLVAALVIPLVVLGVVCWIFWRAAKAEAAERERTDVEWRYAPSS